MTNNFRIEDSSVLVLSNLPSYPGKVTRHLHPLANVVKEVTIIAHQEHETIENEILDNISIISHQSDYNYINIFLEFIIGLYNGLEKEPDCIVGVSLFPHGLYALLIGFILRKPVHLRIIGADIPVHSRAWYGRLPRFLFTLFDSVAVHGEQHRQYLISIGVESNKIHILPGSINLDNYRSSSRKPKYDFLWVGRMESHKHPEIFVNALHLLNKSGIDFRAVMVGDGGLEPEIDEVIAKSNLDSLIDRPGWVNNVAKYYEDSKIFVLTSEREALGYPLVEAMASGLACIAPKFEHPADGNTSYLISDMENGLLLENMDPESLADCMEELLFNKENRDSLGESALQSSKRFSQQNMSDGWTRVIENLYS